MAQKGKQLSEKDDLVESFYYFDTDQDGYLSSVELRHILVDIAKMGEHDATEMINEADPNGTGKINYSDFVERMWGVIEQFNQ